VRETIFQFYGSDTAPSGNAQGGTLLATTRATYSPAVMEYTGSAIFRYHWITMAANGPTGGNIHGTEFEFYGPPPMPTPPSPPPAPPTPPSTPEPVLKDDGSIVCAGWYPGHSPCNPYGFDGKGILGNPVCESCYAASGSDAGVMVGVNIIGWGGYKWSEPRLIKKGIWWSQWTGKDDNSCFGGARWGCKNTKFQLRGDNSAPSGNGMGGTMLTECEGVYSPAICNYEGSKKFLYHWLTSTPSGGSGANIHASEFQFFG